MALIRGFSHKILVSYRVLFRKVKCQDFSTVPQLYPSKYGRELSLLHHNGLCGNPSILLRLVQSFFTAPSKKLSTRIASNFPAMQSSIQDPVLRAKKYSIYVEDLVAMLEQTRANNRLVLLDVRDTCDVKETGMIPGAINVPLGELKKTLSMDANEFYDEFGQRKPTRDGDEVPLVLYGHCSVKSTTALEIAYKLGFKKARHYPGGWEEWSAKFPTKRQSL